MAELKEIIKENGVSIICTPKRPMVVRVRLGTPYNKTIKGVIRMGKFKNWKDIKKELNFRPEEIEEMELEKIIKETIVDRKSKIY